MHDKKLLQSIYECILELSTEEGINASGKGDVYGCIFGRDSAITILKLLNAISRKSLPVEVDQEKIKQICRRALLTLTELQGKQTNYESGEEPGKFIHEYRKDNYERLLVLEKPWYVYPDGILRNYDSVDSTPLALIAIYKYWQLTDDSEFLLKVLPAVESGLNWMITYGDFDKDFLLEYELPKDRVHGGLPVQSWTDSHESMETPDGVFPLYPIAPVEVQGYAWLALKLWADFYGDTTNTYAQTEQFSRKLISQAAALKKRFNEIFIFEEDGKHYAAQALDGHKNQIKTITGNPLLLLWATYVKEGKTECIVAERYIPDIVTRAFAEDMFDKDAGIRTMSTKASNYIPGPNSYHNGSFWPKLNGMSHEGLTRWGYVQEAALLKAATLKPIEYFGSPIELYVKTDDGSYQLFLNNEGQESCRQQAWTAAAAFDLLVN